MINVLYLSHEGSDIGGSTKSLMNMISSLKGQVNPIVIAPAMGHASEYVLAQGVELHVLPFNLSFTDKRGIERALTFIPRVIRDYLRNSKAKKQIRQIIGRRTIAIVHSNSASIDFGRDLAREIGAKHVWHLREFLDADFNFSPLIGWDNFRRKIRGSDAVICISKSIQNHYKLAESRNATVIHNAIIKSSAIPALVTKDSYILFTGKVSPAKGVEDAINAFVQIAKNSDLNLIIAGKVDPNYQSFLTTKVEKYVQSGRIRFIGFSDRVEDLMAKAQCLLMCSKNEALGRVTVEAMYNGCAVIGYNNAGTSEIIEHGVNGFLYKDNEELVKQIEYVISNDLSSMLRKSQESVLENFSENAFSKKMWMVYEHL
jgi:glycosyltransferase involved in cell wall biosynthesis